VAELADLMRSIADGDSPATDRALTVVPPPDDRSVGVLAFAGHNVVSADLAADWVRRRLPDDDLDAPLRWPFVTMLAAATDRVPAGLDLVLVAQATGRPNGMALTELTDFGEPPHPRRIGARAWRCPGGLLTLGRGVAGRWEVSVEVEAPLRGFGLGRALFTAARGLLPSGEHVWAQVAPGNASSTRAALAAGFRPVGAEVLLRQGMLRFGDFGWFVEPEPPPDTVDGPGAEFAEPDGGWHIAVEGDDPVSKMGNAQPPSVVRQPAVENETGE
jgi:GNAT superfamily N-acetyltransferase